MNQILKRVGLRFQSTFKLVDGSSFKGQILEPPDTSRVSNFLSARRYLRVMPESRIKPTDVMIATGMKFIIAEHGYGYYVDPIYRHMKIFQVDEEYPLLKMKEVVDPVTGVKSKVPDGPPVTIYLSTQPKPDIDDRIKIPTEQIQAVCNYPVMVGDVVGPYKVIKVDKELGVYVCEMKRT